MMELQNDIVIKCLRCNGTICISKEQAMPSVNTEDHDQGMGIEYSYFIEDEISCPHCSASIGYQVYGSEYPVGAYNNDWAAITENAVFLETPRMDVVYDFSDEDIDQAFYYADDPTQERIKVLGQKDIQDKLDKVQLRKKKIPDSKKKKKKFLIHAPLLALLPLKNVSLLVLI